MPPISTWLIRHGESLSNAGLPAFGNADIGLTEQGEQQSLEVAQQIRAMPNRLIVSPFLRARMTAKAIEQNWHGLRAEVWPIQELTYLSPTRCLGTTSASRQIFVNEYWLRCDPDYRDGVDAESFRAFMARLLDFHHRLQALNDAFVTVIGHGHFFSAYLFALKYGFTPSPQWMRDYRAAETARPLCNGEIVKLLGGGLSRETTHHTGE